MVPTVETPRPRGLILTFAIGFALAAAVALTLAHRTGIFVFASLAGLGLWAMTVSIVALLPRLRFRLRGALCALGLLATIAAPASIHVFRQTSFSGATDSFLQLAAVVLAVLAFGFHFLATYGQHVGRETP